MNRNLVATNQQYTLLMIFLLTTNIFVLFCCMTECILLDRFECSCVFVWILLVTIRLHINWSWKILLRVYFLLFWYMEEIDWVLKHNDGTVHQYKIGLWYEFLFKRLKRTAEFLNCAIFILNDHHKRTEKMILRNFCNVNPCADETFLTLTVIV